MNSFKDSLNDKDKYFGINPSKAARIARWNAIKDGISKEWQKINVPRTLTTVAVISFIGLGGSIAHQSFTARSINNETALNSRIARQNVNEAMQRRADKIIARYNLKREVARGVRNYVESEVEKMGLKSNLSFIEARVKKIILMNREKEKVENKKRKEIKPEVEVIKVNVPQENKKRILYLEQNISMCNQKLKQLRPHKYDSKGIVDSNIAKKMDNISGSINAYTSEIYRLDPSRKSAVISAGLQPAKIEEATQTLTGTVTWNATYEFPISKNYEADKLSKEAIQRYTNDTKISDFERYTFTDMCNFPFSVVRIENGRFSCFILVPHIAFRKGDKVTLSMRTLPDKSISYQQIINQTLGKGYKAMQTADVRAEYIAVESKRTE